MTQLTPFRSLPRLFSMPAACLLLLSLTGTASAQMKADQFHRTGFYFGAGGVYQHNVFEDRIEEAVDDALDNATFNGQNVAISNFRLDVGDSGGLNLLAGYRAASFFAAELMYEWVDDFDVEVSGTGTVTSGPATGAVVSVSGDLYNIEGHTLTLNTKWIVPFWRIQPYATVGVGLSSYEVDRGDLAPLLEALTGNDFEIEQGQQTALAGRFGGGIDWYITKNILLNTYANVVLTTRNFNTPSEDNADDLNYVGFGGNLQYRF